MSRIILGLNDVSPSGALVDKLSFYVEYLEDEKHIVWKGIK